MSLCLLLCSSEKTYNITMIEPIGEKSTLVMGMRVIMRVKDRASKRIATGQFEEFPSEIKMGKCTKQSFSMLIFQIIFLSLFLSLL